uniref:Uncharacterized protein n=1 Tax=Aegilops tauschii subsp. strangulata TaxID=200361 RepID=A0A453GB33_AEGTS
ELSGKHRQMSQIRPKASAAWNISGEPCSGAAIDGTDIDSDPELKPAIKCDCSYNASTVCHITRL